MAQFLKNITENKKYAFSLQLIFETSIILRIIQRDIINICGSSYPTTVILEKIKKICILQISSSGSRVVLCRLMEGAGRQT
jgi:predicted AAA+ superfamily ATPase